MVRLGWVGLDGYSIRVAWSAFSKICMHVEFECMNGIGR